MRRSSLCLVFMLPVLSLLAQRSITEKIIDEKDNLVANAVDAIK